VRVAALSDIHGNQAALEAVLEEVEKAKVDVVVCAGDIVGGPFSVEVFDRLTSLPHARFVRGNADRLVLVGTDEHGQDWAAARERLGEARLASIASWPLTIELEIDGVGRTLFCHAIPTADEPIFTRMTPDEEVVELLGDVEADLVVCGHTHVQFDRQLGPWRVVNAGSVGLPYEGRAGAYWLLVGPDVEHRRTDYDVELAAATMRAGGNRETDELVRLHRHAGAPWRAAATCSTPDGRCSSLRPRLELLTRLTVPAASPKPKPAGRTTPPGERPIVTVGRSYARCANDHRNRNPVSPPNTNPAIASHARRHCPPAHATGPPRYRFADEAGV
jgi:putative phosphoesterase